MYTNSRLNSTPNPKTSTPGRESHLTPSNERPHPQQILTRNRSLKAQRTLFEEAPAPLPPESCCKKCWNGRVVKVLTQCCVAMLVGAFAYSLYAYYQHPSNFDYYTNGTNGLVYTLNNGMKELRLPLPSDPHIRYVTGVLITGAVGGLVAKIVRWMPTICMWACCK